jgi:hypothetical protein
LKKEGKTNFTTQTQQDLMKIIEWMAVDVMRPQTLKEIMDGCDLSYNKTLWAVQNMKLRGWAEDVADGWRLSSRLPRIAEDVRKGIAETGKRYLGD